MNIFKTKYQLLPSTIDEMQYIKRDNSESSYKDQNLLFKNPNYTASHIKAVSGSKYLAIKANRLSGKGVNKEKNIYRTPKAELDAFILGINAMDGWHGYHVIGENGDFATLADLKEYYSYATDEELEG